MDGSIWGQWWGLRMHTLAEEGDRGSIVLCHCWPPSLPRTNVPCMAQSYKWRKLRGVTLPPYKGVLHTLPPPPWTASWFHLFFARPDKTGCVDGQNMLMSFPQRIFAKYGKTHIWTGSAWTIYRILEQAGGIKYKYVPWKNLLVHHFASISNVSIISWFENDLIDLIEEDSKWMRLQ